MPNRAGLSSKKRLTVDIQRKIKKEEERRKEGGRREDEGGRKKEG